MTNSIFWKDAPLKDRVHIYNVYLNQCLEADKRLPANIPRGKVMSFKKFNKHYARDFFRWVKEYYMDA